jgi:hypothetical protein
VNIAQKIKFSKLKLGVFLQSSSTSGQPQKYLYELFAALEKRQYLDCRVGPASVQRNSHSERLDPSTDNYVLSKDATLLPKQLVVV